MFFLNDSKYPEKVANFNTSFLPLTPNPFLKFFSKTFQKFCPQDLTSAFKQPAKALNAVLSLLPLSHLNVSCAGSRVCVCKLAAWDIVLLLSVCVYVDSGYEDTAECMDAARAGN